MTRQDTRQLCVVPDCRIPRQHHQTCDDTDCTGCLPGLAADGLLICTHHHRTALRELRRLPTLDRDLSSAVATRTKPVSVGYVMAGSESVGITLDQYVMDAQDYLRSALTNMIGYVMTERGMAGPEWNVLSMTLWLHRHATWMSANKRLAPVWGTQVANVAAEAYRRAYKTRPDGVLVGHCTTCDAPLRFKPSDYAGDRIVTCRKCTEVFSLDTLAEQLGDPATTASAVDMVAILGHRFGRVIDSATIRQWVHRYPDAGITAGKDPQGRTVYKTQGVLTLVRDTLGWEPSTASPLSA